MDLLSVIRRWHGRDKLSIREISRRTGLSRHTIRKYLANGIVEPKYPLRRSVSKLDPFSGTLSTWLKRESGRNRKRRRSLKSLKLFGMAGAIAELAEQGAPAYHQSTGLLDQLIKAEVADREVRSINYQMKVARFPAHRDLSGFTFNDSAVNEALVRTLHRSVRSWMKRRISYSSAGPAPARRTSPPRSASRPSCTITGG